MSYFQRIYIRAYDTDAGVEGQVTPKVADLPTTAQISLDVEALNFRALTKTEEIKYLGGYHYSTRKNRIKCDIKISKLVATFDYPTPATTVEAFYYNWWSKSNYHWLIFDTTTPKYNLPPDMVTDLVNQEAWACNLHLNEPQADPENGKYIVSGYLISIKDS